MRMKWFILLLPILLVGCDAVNESDDFSFDEVSFSSEQVAQLAGISNAVSADAIILENYAMCPLNRARLGDFSATSIERDDGYCAENLEACWASCQQDDAEACRDLAGVYEDYEDIDEVAAADSARRLHAQACALGHANACTNRAAGIVNAKRDDDPVEPLSDDARALCTIVMYEDACAQEEYWGCAQVSLERGEDGPEIIRDIEKSAEAEIAACRINAVDEGGDPDNCA